jgi:4-amino-4-deoxy-L-arabinose transferase-like glycosyltransferase
MKEPPAFSILSILALLLVVAGAAGARAGYLVLCADAGRGEPALQVQVTSSSADFRQLAGNERDSQWFGCSAPLATKEEATAHRAPGYPWLLGQLARFTDWHELIARWANVAFGTLAAGFLFLFARRAFQSNSIAVIAGLLATAHPFWILNTGEVNDGALATFLLSACLMLGTRGSQMGGPFTSLLFGLSLAGLSMTRAALLPFSVVALLWFLWQTRSFKWGWFAGLLAFLGFANGLAPWAVRNYQQFGQPIPVVTSAYLHLWVGNNPKATGSNFDEATLRSSLSAERLTLLLSEPNQAKRYGQLGRDFLDEITGDPASAVKRRFTAAGTFLLGESGMKTATFARMEESEDAIAPPDWLADSSDLILRGTLLGLLLLALLGWKWSQHWDTSARLLTIAALWVPLPYLLSHGEGCSGPRLPWDAVLLCYAAVALVGWLPAVKQDGEAATQP